LALQYLGKFVPLNYFNTIRVPKSSFSSGRFEAHPVFLQSHPRWLCIWIPIFWAYRRSESRRQMYALRALVMNYIQWVNHMEYVLCLIVSSSMCVSSSQRYVPMASSFTRTMYVMFIYYVESIWGWGRRKSCMPRCFHFLIWNCTTQEFPWC